MHNAHSKQHTAHYRLHRAVFAQFRQRAAPNHLFLLKVISPVQCAVCATVVQCTVFGAACNLQCGVWSVQCAVCSLPITVCTVKWLVCSVLCAVRSLKCAVCGAQCEIGSVYREKVCRLWRQILYCFIRLDGAKQETKYS